MTITGSLSKIRSLNVTYSYSVAFIKDDSTSWSRYLDISKTIDRMPSKYEMSMVDLATPTIVVAVIIGAITFAVVRMTNGAYDSKKKQSRGVVSDKNIKNLVP